MMKTSLRMSVVAGLAAFLVSFGATAAERTFNLGGDAEYDLTWGKTTFSNSAGDIATFKNGSVKNTNEGGRIQLKGTARIDNDWGSYVEAVVAPRFDFQGNYVATGSQGDRYLKFGKKTWDVQLGRFEAIDLFPLGKDTAFQRASAVAGDGTGGPISTSTTTTTDSGGDTTTSTSTSYPSLDTANGILGYQANNVRGRDSSNRIQGAAHFNVGKTQVELGAAYGDANGTKTTGIRPVVKFDAGRFRVAAGYDMLNIKDTAGNTNKTDGFGLTAGTTVGTIKANVNYAQGKQKLNSVSQGTMKSFGLNGERGRFGAGYVHDKTGNSTGKQDTFYMGYTVPLMGTKNARVTFAANTSKAKYDNGDRAKNNSLRARFNYDF